MYHPMKSNPYLSFLKSTYMGKMNPAFTCKLARFESDGVKHYTFNHAKLHLDKWLDKCDNEKYCEELFKTFQKCQCS